MEEKAQTDRGKTRKKLLVGIAALIVVIALLVWLVSCVKQKNAPQAAPPPPADIYLLEGLTRHYAEFEGFDLVNKREVDSLVAEFGDATLGVLTPDKGRDDYGEYDVSYYDKGSQYPRFRMLAAVYIAGQRLAQKAAIPATPTVLERLFLQLSATLDDKEQAHFVYADGSWGAHDIVLPRKPAKDVQNKPGGYKKPKPIVVSTTAKPSASSTAQGSSSGASVTTTNPPPPRGTSSQGQVTTTPGKPAPTTTSRSRATSTPRSSTR